MPVTQQVRVNGGAPDSSGTVDVVVGDTIQPTAASFATWASPVATWKIYDFPAGFAAPAGWSYDATSEAYYYSANGNPPTFDVDPWGAYMISVLVFEGGVGTTYIQKVVAESPNGIRDIGRNEGALDGGTNKRWAGIIQSNYRIIDGLLGGSSFPFVVDDGGTTYLYISSEGTTIGNATSEADQDGAIKIVGNAAPSGSPTAGSGFVWWSTADFGLKTRDSAGLVCNLARINPSGVLLGAVEVLALGPLVLRCDTAESNEFWGGSNQQFGMFSDGSQSILTGFGGSTRIHANAGDVVLTATTGDGIDCQVNSVSCLRVTATDVALGAAVATMSPAIAFTLQPTISAGVGKALACRGGEAQAAGAGGDFTHGGGPGDTPGTHFFGHDITILGNPVSSETARAKVQSTPGTDIKSFSLVSGLAIERYGSGAGISGNTGLNDLYIDAASITLFPLSGGGTITLAATIVENNGQYSSAPATQAFTATPTFNFNASNHQEMAAATANITSVTPSNARPGAIYTIEMRQDGVGASTVAGWNAAFHFDATFTNVLALGANTVTVWTFKCGSDNILRCISRSATAA